MTTPRLQTEVAKKPAEGEVDDRMQMASRLDDHLAQAAKLASDFGVPPDAFAAAAWHAYLHASPALAAHIEQLQFLAGIEELRNAGRLAQA
jgi:hypothetical protein